jgi:hypothetical protein
LGTFAAPVTAAALPKIATVLIDHAAPGRLASAAQITLARDIHALPDDLVRARETLAGGVS